jgi:hypothetical protein
MSQPSIQTNPLFANSLRSWQAAWRAAKGLAGEAEGNPASTTGAPRRVRRVVRPRRLSQPRAQA